MAQNVVDYNAVAPNFSSVKDQIDMYGGGGGGSQEEIENIQKVLCAEVYDSTKTYTSGDYVWHDGKLYLYGKPSPITGDFDPTQWMEKNDQIKEMNNTINAIRSLASSIKYALASDMELDDDGYVDSDYSTGDYAWAYFGYMPEYESWRLFKFLKNYTYDEADPKSIADLIEDETIAEATGVLVTL